MPINFKLTHKSFSIKYSIYYIALFIIFSCGSDVDLSGLEKFYFPVEELEDGRVYTYASMIDDRHPKEKWVYQFDEKNSYLISKNMDQENRVVLEQIETIVSNGALLEELELISYDSVGFKKSTKAEISGANIYSYEWVDTNNILFYKISYPEIDDTTSMTSLIKNRSFGGFVEYTFAHKSYRAMKIHSREVLQLDKDGSIEINIEGEEIYAEGLGRVSFKKKINGGIALDYGLSEIQDLSLFEKENGRIKF